MLGLPQWRHARPSPTPFGVLLGGLHASWRIYGQSFYVMNTQESPWADFRQSWDASRILKPPDSLSARAAIRWTMFSHRFLRLGRATPGLQLGSVWYCSCI